MANQIVKKVGIYFIGNMATKVTMALMIPIYAFFVLPDALGLFDFIQALTLLVAPVLYAAIWESLLRFILIEEDAKAIERTISTVVLFFFSVTLLIIFLSCVVLVFNEAWRLEIICCAAMMVFYSGAQIWQYFARGLKQSKLYTASGIISALVNFALILILVCLMSMQFIGLAISYIVGQVAIFIIIEAKIKLISKMRKSYLDLHLLKEIMRFSLPLAANLLFLTIINSFGRVVVTTFFGAETNGLYTFALRFGSIVSALGGIFSMAIIEESILRIGKEGSIGFLSIVADITTKALFQLSSLVLPFVGLFFFIIQNTGYYEAWSYSPLTILYGSLVVLSTVIGNVFQIEKKTERAMISTFFGALIVIVGSLVSVFLRSFYGILASLVFGALVMLILRIVLGRKLIAYDFPALRVCGYVCLFVAQVGLYFYSLSSMNLVLLIIWSVVAAALYCPMIIKQYKALSAIPDV